MTHGKYSTYRNHRCRCAECVAAWNAWVRDYNHRTGRHKPKDEYLAALRAANDTHGREARYLRGCRCDECREASRVARTGRRARASG